jgi:hypothetical protein
MRATLIFSAILLCSCATETQVVGRGAARLSAADVEQIRVLAATELARTHQHPAGPPRILNALRPDYVHVAVPIRDRYSDTAEFDMVKRSGHWIVSLARGETVIVE